MTALTFDRPVVAAGSSGADFGGELLQIMKRRRWIIIGTIVLITTAAALFAMLWPPVYTATAKLLVSTQSVDQRLSVEAAPTAAQDEALIANQVQLLSGRGLAQQVVTSLGLDDDLTFAPNARPQRLQSTAEKKANMEAATANLMRRVAVRRVDRSGVILISVKSKSPEQAAQIADRYVAEDIRLMQADYLRSNASTVALLKPQVAAMREQVMLNDRAVADYRRRYNMVGTPDAPDLSQFGQLAGALTEARSSRSEAMVRSSVAAGGVGAATAATSPLLNDLRQQAADVGKRAAELSSFYGKGYPELARTEAQLADLNHRIAEETTRIARQLRSEVSVGQARESQISSDLSRLNARTMEQRSASVRLMDLQRTAEASRSQYVLLLGKLEQLNGAAALVQVPVKLLTAAVVPEQPSFPRRNEVIAVALAGGFVLGLILAYAVELLSERRVRTTRQVQELVGTPTLGMIPEFDDRHSGSIQHRMAQRPQSALAEAMRGVYLDCRQRMPAARSHILLVTSPLPGEGKTTIAMGVASAAALLGRRAVVIDLDLRKPDVLNSAGIADGPDLLGWLAGNAVVDDVIMHDPEIAGLAYVGVREPVKDAAACLASPRLTHLIDRLRERYDLLVLNAPPVLGVRDAKTLAGRVHGTLLVLRWGQTRTDAARAAVETFGAPFTGAVLNRVDVKRHAAAAFGDELQHYGEYSSYFGGGEAPRARQAA